MFNAFLGNLSFKCEDADLVDFFTELGYPPIKAKVITDKDSGQSRGFAFVEFEDEHGPKAVEDANGQEFMGRAINCNEARPREARPAGGGQRDEKRGRGAGGGNRW